MNYIDIRRMSLEFRRISSNLLCSDDSNADVNLSRFFDYINKTPFISELIHKAIDNISFDYKECFIVDSCDWASIVMPKDEKEHIKAMYDYIAYIENSENVNVLQQALRFGCANKKFKEIIQSFLDKSFKPLIDFIVDQISMELMIMEEERKNNMSNNEFVTNIQNLHGNVNQQGSGNISSFTVYENDSSELLETISKALAMLNSINDSNREEIEDIKDDLESVKEQIISGNPKKNRINKALMNLKNFANQLPVNVVASSVANVIVSIDWVSLINQIEGFLSHIH